MFKHNLLIKVFAVICLISLSCTNVPLSNNSETVDSRLLNGYWVSLVEKSAYRVKKNSNNDQFLLYSYEYNPATKKWKANSDGTQLIATTISDEKGSKKFFSIKNDENQYANVTYEFTGSGDMIVRALNEKEERFSSSDAFRKYVKGQLRNSALYEKDAYTYKFQTALDISFEKSDSYSSIPSKPSESPKSCTNSSYEITSMKTREYIRDLKAWDDWSQITDVSGQGCSLKFFPNGAMLKLSQGGQMVAFNLANVSFKSTSSGANTYTAIVKQDGAFLGSAYLVIQDYTYSELQSGVCTAVVGVQFDNTTLNNILDNFLNGSNMVTFLMEVKSMDR